MTRSKHLFSIFLPLLFLAGAGCISDQLFTYSQPTEDLAQDSESTQWTTYRTTGKSKVLFAAPEDWFVRQADAGNASVITIAESKDSESSIGLVLELTTSIDAPDGRTYEDWLALRGFTQKVRDLPIGDVTFSAWETDDGEVVTYTRMVTTSEFPFFVSVRVPNSMDDAIADEILTSIQVTPTQEEQDAAESVPEWSLDDTR